MLTWFLFLLCHIIISYYASQECPFYVLFLAWDMHIALPHSKKVSPTHLISKLMHHQKCSRAKFSNTGSKHDHLSNTKCSKQSKPSQKTTASLSIYLSIYLSLTNCHFEISLEKKILILKHSIYKGSGIWINFLIKAKAHTCTHKIGVEETRTKKIYHTNCNF